MRMPFQSDRRVITKIIMPVIALAVASIAFVIFGLFSVTHQSDRLSMDREIRATQIAIDESIQRLAREQEMVALSGETALALRDYQPDRQWFNQDMGARLHRIYQHDQVFILNSRDEPIYALTDGVRVAPDQFKSIDPDVRSMLRAVRARLQPNDRHGGKSGQTSGVPAPFGKNRKVVQKSQLLNIGGKPAAVSVMLMASLPATAQEIEASPVAISIRFLDSGFFASLAKLALLENPRFTRTGEVGPNERAIILKTENGEAIGNFVWTPERTGSRIFDVLAPVTTTALLAMLALMAWLARSLSRTFRQLREEKRVREQAEVRAEGLARHDSLTGLPNRRVFVEELDRLCTEPTDASTRPGALLFIDVESMRDLNDTFGFEVADEVLVQIACRLRALTDTGLAARLGGDEFSLFLPTDPEVEHIDEIVRSACDALNQPYVIGGAVVPAMITAGVALFPKDGASSKELINAADAALRRAKRAAPAQATFYDAQQDVSGRVGAAERPLRAQQSDRPRFQITEATDTIVRSVCRMAADWPPETAVCLCVPAEPLKDPWFAARLLAVLNSTDFLPSRLIVEVPEAALLNSFYVCSDNLSELQAAGVRIAVGNVRGSAVPTRCRSVTFDHIRIDSLEDAISSPPADTLLQARSA